MKRFFAPVLAAVAFLALAFTNPAELVTKSIDTAESIVLWEGSKVTGKHNGEIKLQSGSLEMDDAGNLVGGSFVIDMNSMTCTDLQGEYGDKLVGHLKSDDFFGVATYPTAEFVIDNVVAGTEAGQYEVMGSVTIKGKTKEVKFNANMMEEGGKMFAKADITIDRTDFDIRYGSGSFFDNLGDRAIYDDFDLQVSLVVE